MTLEYTFGQWLKRQVERRDLIGDVARDYIAPNAKGKSCCGRFQRYDTILRHIYSVHTPHGDSINTLKEAYSEYRTIVKII